jgi:hypothetical protein
MLYQHELFGHRAMPASAHRGTGASRRCHAGYRETARALAHGVDGKTVVITGAMIPYAFGSSDGLFNLGSALSFAQTLAPGVYIAMNGRCFTWDNVRKNRDAGIFEPLTEGRGGA